MAAREEYGERSISKAVKRGDLNSRDADLIREFCDELEATKGISLGRRNKLTFNLVSWRRFIGPFEEVTRTDLHSGIRALKKETSWKGRAYKPNTIADMVAVLKQFFNWMDIRGYSKIPAAEIKRIETPSRDGSVWTVADMLTKDEIGAIMQACQRDVDRAALYTLYEGGLRIGELIRLRWRDLSFDDDGVKLSIEFKTKKPRYIRLVMATEHLAQWRANYPGNASGNALVFINRLGGPLDHGQFTKQIRRISARAGVKKRITPHLFRHSRITHLINEGAQESIIKMIAWGDVGSRMLRTYLHLGGADIDREMARLYGLRPKGRPKKDEAFKPRQCAHCGEVSSPTSQYCAKCGQPLTEEASERKVSIEKYLETNPVYADIVKILPDIVKREVQKRLSESAR